MIIGLTGTKASGKGVIAEILKERGFEYVTLSDIIREEARKRIGNDDYDVFFLQKLGNELRINGGLGVLANIAMKKLSSYPNIVIDGIRNSGEIDEIRKKNGVIISVDAPQEKRFEWLISRKRHSDPKNWNDFLKMEEIDHGKEEESSGQQVIKCISMADYRIINSGTKEDLKKDVFQILSIIEKKNLFNEVSNSSILNSEPKKENLIVGKREKYLSWDEYFMGVAFLSAKRSKDPNSQVGACIVNEDKKIVGTGYNGFPLGCSDDNLPWNRKGNFLETKYPYVCHAELNAILNSTKNLRNCTIYVGMFPCNECAKAIIQSGIKEVVYLSDKYSETDSVKAAKKMFNQSGIRQKRLILKDNILKIDFNSLN
jgi:dCMP deaminase